MMTDSDTPSGGSFEEAQKAGNIPLRTVLVDDELRNIKGLQNLLNQYCEGVEVVATATTVEEAHALIEQHQPDLVFLDIVMPPHNGFELLNQFQSINFEVVFVTSHQEYAIRAIRYSALDYLLKPVNINELKEAIARVRQKGLKKDHTSPASYELLQENLTQEKNLEKIILPSFDGLFVTELKDIVYCQADGSYTCFYLSDGGKMLVSQQLKEYEDLLTNQQFFRIHRQYLINLNQIKQYLRRDGGVVIMSNGQELPIAVRRREAFMQLLQKSAKSSNKYLDKLKRIFPSSGNES